MELEKGQIGNNQLSILITGFIIGTSIILFPGGQAKHDAWIAIFLGMVEGIIFALVYAFLSRRFPGKSLIEINDLVYGPYCGKIISLAFLWYLFHLDSMVIGNIKDFLSIGIMPRTPNIVFSIIITAVCAYAIAKGVEVLVRCSQILAAVTVGAFFLVVTLLIKDIHLENLQPILEIPIKDLLAAAQGAASFPFAETVVFMMFIPFVKKKQEIPLTVVKGIFLGGILMTLAAIRNYGVLGASAGIYAYQNFQGDRLINIGNLLTRLEVITVIAAVSTGFIKISVLLYGTVLGGAQLLGLRSYRPLILPVAILMIIQSELNFKNITDNIIFAQQIYPIYALPFQLGIPLLTFIVALIRGLPKQRKTKDTA